MKMNWKEILRIAGRLIVAAPAIIEAVGPVLTKRQQPPPEKGTSAPPAASEITLTRG